MFVHESGFRTSSSPRYWVPVVLACLFVSSCVLLSTRDDEPTLRRKAETFLDQNRLDYYEWRNARVATEAFPVYRPDIEEPAYFEFPVVDSQTGAASGFILMSTGSEDHKVAQWSTTGLSNSQELLRKPGMEMHSDVRLYLVDFFSLVAEGKDGELIAQLGEQRVSKQPGQWREFKQTFAQRYSDQINALQEDVNAELRKWESLTDPLADTVCDRWRSHFAGSATDQRRYAQISANTYPNTSDCSSGCGATAWAMLFGWVDFRASEDDPIWRSSFGMYGGSNEVAPHKMDAGIRDMIWEIRNDLGTSCKGSQGFTAPWAMDQAKQYLSSRINSSPQLVTRIDMPGVPNDRTTGRADEVIRSGGPVVILLGWEHYPLAWGYSTRRCGPIRQHRFLINPGDGVNDRWTHAKTSFAGWVKPYPNLPPPPSCAQDETLCYRNYEGRPVCVPSNAQCPDDSHVSGCPGQVCCDPGTDSCRTCAPSYLECPSRE